MRYTVFILLILPAFLFAEPGTATRYLTGEPASLFDLGMLQMRQGLGQYEQEILEVAKRDVGGDRYVLGNVFVDYNHNDDKIEVVAIIFAHGPVSETPCFTTSFKMREKIIPDYLTWFAHNGYERPNKPRNFDKDFAKVFEITCIQQRINSKETYTVTRNLANDKIGRKKLKIRATTKRAVL